VNGRTRQPYGDTGIELSSFVLHASADVLVSRIVIVISRLTKRHLTAKRRTPTYSQANQKAFNRCLTQRH